MSSKIVTAPGAYPRIPRSFFMLVRSVFRTVVALSCPGERKGKDVALHWRVIYIYILANEFIIALLFSRHRLELSRVGARSFDDDLPRFQRGVPIPS